MDDNTQDHLRRLRKQLKDDSNMLPYFIDNKNLSDRNCYDMSRMMFIEMNNIVSQKIISKAQIRISVKLFEDMFTEMTEISDYISINYYSFFADMLHTYFQYSKRNELWETCSNIRNFYEIFYKEKFTDNNDKKGKD